jgi:hypothetical protein
MTSIKLKTKKKSKLNQEISKMNLEKTDLTILLPRAGEFKQPKGEGFSIGNKRQMGYVDVNQGYLYILGEDYFEELGLKRRNCTFHRLCIQSLNLKNIKKKGYFLSEDIAKFQVLAEKK